MTQLSPEVISAIDERMLANRYRYDDPLPADRLDNLWFWSENHRIINLVIEYLTGQEYPEEMFVVAGRSGAEHRERAARDIPAGSASAWTSASASGTRTSTS